MGQGIPEVMVKLLELSGLLGVKGIKDLPACWEPTLPGGWRVAVNGHREATACSWGASVPPFSALFEQPEFVGAMMIVSPHGGTAIGEGVEDACIAAVATAIAAASGQGSLFPEPSDGR